MQKRSGLLTIRAARRVAWFWVWFLAPFSMLSARWSSDFDGKGVVEIEQALQRLTAIASVLHTGAHPDDEDSGLLAYLARAQHARTAYLAVTRGDGGQNLIGPELYDALGVIRTEELLAARRVDGAEQYFTQGYDFGFSKSAQEALSKWDRAATLGDMVRIIRTFRPLVIVSRFSGRPSDGHGHHQAAGILTPEAFRAAADPTQFPEHLAEGLPPWTTKKLYRHAPEKEATLRINTGEYSPVLGRSYFQIGIEGRNKHRSQAQGEIPQKGLRWSSVRRVEPPGDPAQKESSIFDGIDTTLVGIAAWAGSEIERVPFLVSELKAIQQSAERALQTFKAAAPHAAAEPVFHGLQRLRALRAQMAQSALDKGAKYEILFLLDKKVYDFMDAANATLGLTLDILANQSLLIPGRPVEVSMQFFNRSPMAITPTAVEVLAPSGWTKSVPNVPLKPVGYNENLSGTLTLTPSAEAAYTQPYWLRRPRRGDRFTTDDVSPSERGQPSSAPEVIGRIRYQAFGVECALEQPLQYRYADRSLGEVRKPVPVVPPVSVALAPDLLALPVAQATQERTFQVTLLNHRPQRTQGTVRVTVPPAWPVPPPQDFAFEKAGERAVFRFRVQIPAGLARGAYHVEARADLEGKTYHLGYTVLAYPHITPRNIYRPAAARVQAMDVRVAAGLRIGYVMGTGDTVPQALEQLGVPVTPLTAEDIATGDLRSYSAIIVGIRAYAVRDDLRAYHQRLMGYVRGGGLLVVQYQTADFPAPYRLRLGRPADRVSVEEAPVRILEPDHPLFQFPNRITDGDFEGWVQERGLNFMSEWEKPFRPLLSSNDPGEPPRLGGLLVTPYGQGTYVYTGYAWFRQLPAGVPGAYRLFANLISLPKAR